VERTAQPPIVLFSPHDTTWQELMQSARSAGVAFPTALQVSQRAYEIGQFALSLAAFSDADIHGQVSSANQRLMQMATSAAYNQGYWLARADSDQARAELMAQRGPDPKLWPAPAPSPLLTACAHQ
jgi:hypothetical protein